MINMSYCRFENTLLALRECMDALALRECMDARDSEEHLDENDPLSDSERDAMQDLLDLAADMVEYHHPTIETHDRD